MVCASFASVSIRLESQQRFHRDQQNFRSAFGLIWMSRSLSMSTLLFGYHFQRLEKSQRIPNQTNQIKFQVRRSNLEGRSLLSGITQFSPPLAGIDRAARNFDVAKNRERSKCGLSSENYVRGHPQSHFLVIRFGWCHR